MYTSGIQYIKEGNGPWQMEFVQTAEGRVEDPMGNRTYEYDLKDHLGNSRVMFSETGETVSEVPGYYPFGMTFDHPNVPGDHKYLYNGVEFQNELGLDLYQTLFRLYDPAIGRFVQIDPLADFMPGINPYNFGLNNPILFGDPDGLAPMWWSKLKAHVGQLVYNMQGRNETFVVVDKKGNQATSGLFNSKPRPNSTPSPSSNNATAQNNTSSNIPTIDRPEPPRFDDNPFPRPTLHEIVQNKHEKNETIEEESRTPVFTGQIIRSRTGTFVGGDHEFSNEAGTKRMLSPIAQYLFNNPNGSIIIQVATNLTNSKSKALNEVLYKRAEAVERILKELGVKPSQIKKDGYIFGGETSDFNIKIK